METIKNEIKIGDRVERLGSSKDYVTGRKGHVVEISEARYRVPWDTESNGQSMKPIRTWVNIKFLRKLNG